MKKLKIKKNIQNLSKKKKGTKKGKSGKFKNIALTSIMILGIIFVTCVLSFGLYIIFTAPDFDSTKLYNKEATVLYDKNGIELTRYGKENRVLVTYNDLPQVFVDALVATEDSRFFQHNGFDAARFTKASFKQALGNSDAGGASTLTMQLVKNTYTSSEASGIRGIIRKFTDIYMAVFKIEKKYTKEEILEFYVNSQEFGIGGTNYGSINGVEQASQHYFGKSVSDLNLSEASLLVGLFNNPYLYNPYRNPEGCTNRRSVVLSLMVRHGYITEEQKIEAEKLSVSSLLKPSSENSKSNPYQAFIDYVIEEVKSRTGVNPFEVPMAIYTTLDTAMQDIVNDVTNGNGYQFLNDEDQIGVAITNVENGALLAMSGGRGYTPLGLNRAKVKRQPGSTAKPLFDYGPLIEYNNVSTVHQFFDEPYTYSTGQSINNWDGRYWGLSNLAAVLIDSRNIPALQAFQQVDKSKIAEFVHGLGIDYGDDLFEAMSIGGMSTGITPIENSAAYSTFARGGYYIEPYSYTKIVYLESGKEEEYKYTKKRVMSEETAYMITNILTLGGSSSYNVGGNIRVNNSDIAAKGGTTNINAADARGAGVPDYTTPDHWNVTYSTDYCIALWYGYDKLSPEHYLTSNTGTRGRKALMQAIANKIYLPNKRFSRPEGVVEVVVEKESIPLQLASEFTPNDLKMTALYKKGTEPTEVSNRFSTLDNPSDGKATVSGNKISLSWKNVETPKAIDTGSLSEYFSAGYGQWAQKYYNQRIYYNNTRIGNIGYQVYVKGSNGSLQSIGYTNSNHYEYTAPKAGEYTFVVKSAYSIFKNNMSSGITIKATASSGGSSGNEGTNEPTNPNTPDNLNVTLNGSSTICAEVGKPFVDINNPIKVTYKGNDVTSSSLIKPSSVDTSAKKTVKLTYQVTYGGKSGSTSRTINVCNSCNADGTCKS